MPRLTAEWYKKLKNDDDCKVKGKVAPDTAIDKAIKNYEAALAAANKKLNTENLDKLLAAYKSASEAIAPSVAALKTKGFETCSGRLADRGKAAILEEDPIVKKLVADFGADQKMAAEQTPQEKMYVAIWDVYDRKRPEIESGPSLALFAEIQALLVKLNAQAESCKKIDAFRAKKYTAQQQVLAAAKNATTAKETAYKNVIAKAMSDRKAVVPVLANLKVTLDKAVADLKGIETKILTGIKLKDPKGVAKLKVEFDTTAKEAVKAYDDESAVYAPEAPLRKSRDIVAAKVHQDDSTAHIAPITNVLFTSYKANSDVKRAIEAKAKEIAAL